MGRRRPEARWPPLAALLLALGWRRMRLALPALPAGDLLLPVEAACRALRVALGRLRGSIA